MGRGNQSPIALHDRRACVSGRVSLRHCDLALVRVRAEDGSELAAGAEDGAKTAKILNHSPRNFRKSLYLDILDI